MSGGWVGQGLGIRTVSGSAGSVLGLPLDGRQATGFLLMAAMSAFAILLIAPRLITWRAGVVLLTLFVAHLFFPDPAHRMIFAYIFFGLSAVLVAMNWRRLKHVFGDALE